MKYFCIWTVVVFGFLKVLVCKVSCGNGWLAKSYDSCSLTVVGRGIFFSVKTVVKWNIWKICSMQNGSSHTFILTFRFDLQERERRFWNSHSQMACEGFTFSYASLCFWFGVDFSACVCGLVNPPLPQITFNFLWLDFFSFFLKAGVKKNTEGKETPPTPTNHPKSTKKPNSQSPDHLQSPPQGITVVKILSSVSKNLCILWSLVIQ